MKLVIEVPPGKSLAATVSSPDPNAFAAASQTGRGLRQGCQQFTHRHFAQIKAVSPKLQVVHSLKTLEHIIHIETRNLRSLVLQSLIFVSSYAIHGATFQSMEKHRNVNKCCFFVPAGFSDKG